MRTKLLLLLLLANFSIYAQYTLIPDINFEKKLIALGLDAGAPDGKILTFNIIKVKSLTLDTTVIADLTGIQDFEALETLICKGDVAYYDGATDGLLQTLDVSKNKNLTYLECSVNKLTSLDVSKNTLLTTLIVESNKIATLNIANNLSLQKLSFMDNLITTIDVSKHLYLSSLNCSYTKMTVLDVSKNIGLLFLNISANKLTTLDVSKNVNIYALYCHTNLLTSLNLSENKALRNFNCSNNPLPVLDISNNILLDNIDCSSTGITTLDLSKNINLTSLYSEFTPLATLDVSNNVKLNYLNCRDSKIKSLDLSKNINLTSLYCIENQLLSALNLQNGNNNKINVTNLNLKGNAILTCIQVDDVAFSNTNWSAQKDATATYNSACSAFFTLIPDANFEKKLIALGLDAGAPDGKVLTFNIKKVKSLTLDTTVIADLTGIQDFEALEMLICKGEVAYYGGATDGLLQTLDVSKNKNLTYLECSVNKLTSLDVSKNTLLTTLIVESNKIATLNIANNLSLQKLSFMDNLITTIDVSKHLYLSSLNCSYTKMTVLDVSKNIGLLFLNISANKLTTLDVSKNVNIYALYCHTNLLTSLNLSENKALRNFNCSNNPLPVLDISNNILLDNIDCSSTGITTLDLSKNINLTSLYSEFTPLATLDVSNNVKLNYLNCRDSKIKSLDLSKNINLTSLYCIENQLLSALNLQNGNNNKINVTNLNLKGNAILTCIQVDDVAFSNTNWSAQKDATATYNSACSAFFTLIPDLNFENKLISLGLDSGVPDGKVLTGNIASVENLDINSSSISNLTGIEGFTSLEVLNCGNNQITTLDFSQNTKLKQLECYKNNLTNLNLSANSDLWYLDCFTNQLTTLDLSQNKLLKTVYCYDNLLNTLNVSNLKNLEYLDCPDNQLTNLDVSINTSLKELHCYRNKLKSLDISKNTVLYDLVCYSNELTSLNLKNGNNTNFIVGEHTTIFTKNPNLTCIEVDDVTYSNTNWSAVKDSTASYSTDCSASFVAIPDQNFEQKLIDLGIDTDGLNGKITTSNISSITSLDLSNSNITDVSGIENFTSLVYLNLSDNKLTSLDVSKNVLLETLNASSNQLTTLDLSQNTKLTIVYVTNNPLVSLNLKNGNNRNFILPTQTAKQSASALYTSFLGLTTLSCIQVDDVAYSNANWSNIKEPNTTYSNTCKNLGVDDSVFAKATIYPNPTNGEVNINNITLEKANVYNELGQLVKTFTLNSGNTNNTINLSGLPKGIYYIYLINGDAASAKKVIVE
jgi:Leucine-rich repeat (LRR) protein